MPITGTFGGFPFDPEVYQGFVDQEATFSDSILASGILANDQSMASALDNGGVQGTIRFYNPLDPDQDAPLVRDGVNDNVPTEISGGKQSWIRIDRMKAWKAAELTRELTAADPMAAVARNTGRYWRMYKQGLLVKLVNAALGVTGLENHSLTVKTGGVTANQLIDVQQSALGDFSGKFGLLVVHSKIMAEYKKLGLLNYNKYTITNVLQKEVSLPTINGLVVIENDRGTDDGTNYNTFLLGQGSVLTANPKVISPDTTEYDAAKAGGTDILYNNRSFILHPNGLSFDADNIAKETPTDTELFIENATRWCASIAAEPEQTELLALCQARLVALSEEVSASWDGVTSVSNHGYTESYASGMDMQSYLGARQQQIVEQTLSAPVTRWMLYQGGVYHPPRRH